MDVLNSDIGRSIGARLGRLKTKTKNFCKTFVNSGTLSEEGFSSIKVAILITIFYIRVIRVNWLYPRVIPEPKVLDIGKHTVFIESVQQLIITKSHVLQWKKL